MKGRVTGAALVLDLKQYCKIAAIGVMKNLLIVNRLMGRALRRILS
jgi:hypothetical protein